MREWDENKLNQELELLLTEVPEQDELEKRIEKYIKNRIRKIVYKTLATIVVAVVLLLALINPLFRVSFIDPTKVDENEQSIYFDVLRDYYETTRPYAELISLDAEYKGLANYKVILQATNHRERLVVGRTNASYDLNCGTIKNLNDPQLYIAYHAGRFDMYKYQNETDWIEEKIEELRKLPDSAHIYVSVYAAQPQSVEAFRNSDIHLEWVEVYQPNVEYRGGLSMVRNTVWNESDAREKMSEAELLDVYCKNLKNLLEHREMWQELELPSASMIYQDVSVLEDTYEDAVDLTELKTERFTLYGKKNDIIEFLESIDIISIQIDEVTLY